MSEENFILVSLDDSKSKEISEILGSKTCKKIINYLSENKEASEKDLSVLLKLPINTIEYNLKKLISSGFIQKRKNFFWSKKGKKISMYELSNKSIVISHKKPNIEKLKSIIPAFILTAAGTFAVWAYQNIKTIRQSSVTDMGAGGIANNFLYKAAEAAPTLISSQPTPLWAWFLAGALLSILIISIINWRKL
ncbi:Uncharacterised protein [uncultured archaeon]|nr:Uncharacterised protein [uncultured archaeon]